MRNYENHVSLVSAFSCFVSSYKQDRVGDAKGLGGSSISDRR